MARLDLVYRDHLFPREAYRWTFDALLETGPERSACRVMVELLALAHDRACESELADALSICLDAGQLPDMAELRGQFSPDPATLPVVTVQLASLSTYEDLLGEGVPA